MSIGLVASGLLAAALPVRAGGIELDAPAGPSRPGLTYVAGRIPAFDAGTRLDLVFAIDGSGSTDEPLLAVPAQPSPGLLARLRAWWVGAPHRPAASGTILAEELRIAALLLDRLDARTTRVGLVAFAGDLDPAVPDARTVVALTDDFARVRAGLAHLARSGSSGVTDPQAGLYRALVELLGTRSAHSVRRDGTRRAVVMLGDGAGPAWRELPAGLARASQAGVQVDAVIVGEEAQREATPGFAALPLQGGRLLRASAPGKADPDVAALRYTRARSVQLRNRTTGAEPVAATLSPDGGFASLLALAQGENRIEVRAWLEERVPGEPGTEIVREFRIRTESGQARDAALALSPRQLAERRRLLELRLQALREARPPEPAPRAERSVEIATERAELAPAAPSER